MRTLIPRLTFSEPYVWAALPWCQSAGNGVRALAKELSVFGIDLSNEFEDAEKNGAKIITEMPVDEILVKNGEVAGVRCGSKILSADIVVLSAGALETPLLLKRLGLPTTPNMFVGTFTTIDGVLNGIEQNKEIVMNAVIESNEFVLYRHFSNHLLKRMEERGLNVSPDDILGLMVKIKDEAVGEVNETVEKGITNRDAVLLSEGASVAGASVLPATPGAPPILAIVALAKYVSKIILARN